MSSTTPAQDQLTLFETTKLVLDELRTTNALLQQHLQQQAKILQCNSDLVYLLNGFTSGGASLSGYLPDAFVSAYIAVVGPALAERLGDTIGIEELMKGGTLLARTLLEELGAYRSEQEGRDLLSNALSLVRDPWSQASSQTDNPEDQ